MTKVIKAVTALLGWSRQDFFWLQMDSDIGRKVHQCDRCIGQKTRPFPAAEHVNITSNAPMDIPVGNVQLVRH